MRDPSGVPFPSTLTCGAKAAISFAVAEMYMNFQNYVDVETILLGIIKSAPKHSSDKLEDLAMRVMTEWNVDPQKILERLEGRHLKTAPALPANFYTYTERGAMVIEFAIAEAANLGDEKVGTEHLLLGIIGVDGLGAMILREFGINAYKVRTRTGILYEQASEKNK